MIRELVALGVMDVVERRFLRRKPTYATSRMGERLFGSALAGDAMRLVYAPAMAWLKRRTKLPALVFGPLVAAFELVAMPLVGATPPVRKWRRGEVPWLFVHATAFALAV